MNAVNFSMVLSLIGILFLFLYFIRPRLKLTRCQLDVGNRFRCTVINNNWFRRILDIQCVIVGSDAADFNLIRTEDLRQNNIMSLRKGQEYTFITEREINKPYIRVKFLASNALGIKKFYEYTINFNQNNGNIVPSKGTHCLFG